MSKKSTKEEFIEKARKIHGNKYDYSKVDYLNGKTKVIIICPEHGEFLQVPEKHLTGQGCPYCCNTLKGTKESFIEKARKVHGNKYDYSKVEYKNNKKKVCIICPEHGEFWQDPHNHLKGKGCPECGKLLLSVSKYDAESFIKMANVVHKGKYDYSQMNYVNLSSKIGIICPEHGLFYQNPYLHLTGCGCPKCADIANGLKRRVTNEEFIERSRKVHGDRYDYSKVEYITAKHKVCIVCPEHGEFWQSPWHHLTGCGCPQCSHYSSKAETEIYDYIVNELHFTDAIQGEKRVLKGKEIDIYIPSKKVGIEYNGLYWHNMTIVKDKNYHLDKTNECKKIGVKLIQIFEDEYESNKEIVLSKISHLLGMSQTLPKIMARKCSIKEISIEESKEFLNKNHIQGFGGGSVHIGAFYNNNLVAVMNFRLEKGKWELTRFASDNKCICQGIGGKLFSYFVKNYNPDEIKSFADRRWTINEDSNVYIKLGFKFDSYTNPEYRYFNPNDGMIRQHKFNFRKQILSKKYGLPLSMTEKEMTEQLGYTKIYDCGLIKYIWKKDNLA